MTRRPARLLVLTSAALALCGPGAVAMIVTSTTRVVSSLESSFDAAVEAGTVFPYTGELDEQYFLPEVALFGWIFVFVLTSVPALILAVGLLRGRLGWPAVLGLGTVLSAIVGGLAWLTATVVEHAQYADVLYGYWYRPFVARCAVAYAAASLGAAALAGTPMVRRRQRQAHRATIPGEPSPAA